ncbi:YciI family protein [Solitalea longa]|nr:YciI family protein [Solitalea longa]
MSDDERKIMQSHVAYWSDLLKRATAIVYGPVFDPEGGYGVGVVSVDSEEQLKQIIAADPANGLNEYEFYPMKAVFKKDDTQ